MNKKKLILSIVLSVVGVAILTVCIFLLKDSFVSNADGEIQIVLVDIEGKTISDKKIHFNEGDTLDKLLKDNYDNVVINNGMIISIDELAKASDCSQFIYVYVNDKESEVGILDIQFEDGTKISFVMTEYVQQ